MCIQNANCYSLLFIETYFRAKCNGEDAKSPRLLKTETGGLSCNGSAAAFLLAAQNSGQEFRQSGDSEGQNRHECHRADDVQRIGKGLVHLHAQHTAGGKQVDRQRRGQAADHQGHQQGDAEVERSQADRYRDGQQDGGGQDDDADRLHEHTKDHQQQEDEGEDKELGVGDAHQPACKHLGHLLSGHEPAEGRSDGDDEHDDAGGNDSVSRHLEEVLQGQLAVDEHGEEQRVDHSHDSGLGSGAQTGKDAAQNGHGHQQGQQSIQNDLHALIDGVLVGVLVLLLLPTDSEEAIQGDEGDDGQQAGGHAAEEHIAHGDAGRLGVDHHDDAGRDDAGHRAAGCDKAGRQALGIPLLQHGGADDLADGGSRGDTGTGNGTEEAAGSHSRCTQTTGEFTKQHIRQLYQSRCTAVDHQGTGKDEHGHRQHIKALCAADHALQQNVHRGAAVDVEQSHAADADGECDRHADEEADRQRNKHQDQSSIHRFNSSSSLEVSLPISFIRCRMAQTT